MANRKTLILNWKSFGSIKMVEDFLLELSKITIKDRVVLALPGVYFFLYNKFINTGNVLFASQDISIFEEENKTGEITANMLRDFNITYTIIGHFERRFYLDEDRFMIGKKINNALNSNIIPIICFGEDFEKRITNTYQEYLSDEILFILNVLKDFFNQNVEFFSDFNKMNKKIILAYEPIWCIGKGITPSNEQVNEIFELVLQCCRKINFPIEFIENCYGGSVNEKNICELIKIQNVNTFLIGKASRNIENIRKIFSYLG